MYRRLIFMMFKNTSESPPPNLTFKLLVKTDNSGTSNNDQFTIPVGTGTYNYDVSTQDGQLLTGNTGGLTITFPSVGTYWIEISGTFPQILFGNGGDRLKLLEIQNWGNIVWDSMLNAFWGCENMDVTAVDTPNLSNVTTLERMFSNCTSLTNLNNSISNWTVSNVTDMRRTFENSSFNVNINNWNVSNVTRMDNMFASATAFNQNIGNWNVSNVTNMSQMFNEATNFNNGGSGDINNWDVSEVTSMLFMFVDASAFNQNIGSWNVSKVTNMSNMFNGATNFNNGGSDSIKDWNVGEVTTIRRMFENTVFNQPIGSWDVSKVTDIERMFIDNAVFNQNISGWDVSSVSNMIRTFENATAFNQDLSTWTLRTSGVTLTSIFQDSGMSCANYTDTIVGWANYVNSNSNSPSNVNMASQGGMIFADTRGGGSFVDAEAARLYLTSTVSPPWTIDGDTVQPNC